MGLAFETGRWKGGSDPGLRTWGPDPGLPLSQWMMISPGPPTTLGTTPDTFINTELINTWKPMQMAVSRPGVTGEETEA